MDENKIVIRTLLENPAASQRELARALNVSLGKTNGLIRSCIEYGYIKKRSVLCSGECIADGQEQALETVGTEQSPAAADAVSTGQNPAAADRARATAGTEARAAQAHTGMGRKRSAVYEVTARGRALLDGCEVDCALILASGFGSRFVPLTYETPKGLLKVFGERMIERQICQLHEVGVRDITIMVGYLKEKFDYLIDKYGVKLRYNPEFAEKNTLATLWRARDLIENRNCYILSSDNWMRENMYHAWEPHAWYAATFMHGETGEWALRFGKKGAITEAQVGGRDAWCMYGPVYFSREFSAKFMPLLDAYYRMPGTEQFYWEDVYIRNIKNLPPLYANCQPEEQVYEFENLEELRRFDEKYVNDSGSRAMRLVSRVFAVPESRIVNIRCLKAGMTNKSWLFEICGELEKTEKPVHGEAKSLEQKSSGEVEEVQAAAESDTDRRESGVQGVYICRIPGPGTEKLINRRQEHSVYEAVQKLGITEDLRYFDPETGYKISRYYKGARNADFSRPEDRRACMGMLKTLHGSGIRLDHRFDLEERINCYERLCRETGQEIPFEDYPEVRRRADRIFAWLKKQDRPSTIAHIDSVKDNFIFTDEGLKMIDWEYAGMADPLTDLGMCAIYSYMDYADARALLRDYAQAVPAAGAMQQAGSRDAQVRAAMPQPENSSPAAQYSADCPALRGLSEEEAWHLVCAYMGLGGLLWALWGVYKSMQGEIFSDYTLRMYRYMKDSYRLLADAGCIEGEI